MTTHRIDEIRAREQAASPGHWGTDYDGKGTYTIYSRLRTTPAEGMVHDGVVAEIRGEHGDEQTYRNARFTAHAREDVKFLLDQVNALEEILGCLTADSSRPRGEVQPISSEFPAGAAANRLKIALAEFRATQQGNALADDLDTVLEFLEFTRTDIAHLRKSWAAITFCLMKQSRHQELTEADLQDVPMSHRPFLQGRDAMRRELLAVVAERDALKEACTA